MNEEGVFGRIHKLVLEDVDSPLCALIFNQLPVTNPLLEQLHFLNHGSNMTIIPYKTLLPKSIRHLKLMLHKGKDDEAPYPLSIKSAELELPQSRRLSRLPVCLNLEELVLFIQSRRQYSSWGDNDPDIYPTISYSTLRILKLKILGDLILERIFQDAYLPNLEEIHFEADDRYLWWWWPRTSTDTRCQSPGSSVLEAAFCRNVTTFTFSRVFVLDADIVGILECFPCLQSLQFVSADFCTNSWAKSQTRYDCLLKGLQFPCQSQRLCPLLRQITLELHEDFIEEDDLVQLLRMRILTTDGDLQGLEHNLRAVRLEKAVIRISGRPRCEESLRSRVLKFLPRPSPELYWEVARGSVIVYSASSWGE